MGLKLFKDRWADEEFFSDLDALAGLDKNDLLKFAEWVKSVGDLSNVSDEEGDKVVEIFPELEKQKKLDECFRVTRFILRVWESLDLSLEQIANDFRTIKLEQTTVSKLQDYFHNLESIKRKALIDYLKRREERGGIPLLKKIYGSWDMRAVFEEDIEGKTFGELIEYVPIAILTIVTHNDKQDGGEGNKTILQFTKEDFYDFMSYLKRFENLADKIKKE